MLTKYSQVKESLHSKLHCVIQKRRTCRTLITNTRLITEQQQCYKYHPQQRALSTCFMTNTNTIHYQCRLESESINNSITSEQLRKAYAILGLHTSASDTEIKQAYQRYVKLYHPDLWHTSSHSSSGNASKNNHQLMTNTNQVNSNKKEEFRVNNVNLEELENVRDEDSNIRDRMAAGNEAYQLLRKMTFAQRQKILSRTFPLNEFHNNNNYSYASTSNQSFDASAPFMNNGSSFHCSPEEYERAQRVYYGEARALRQKRNGTNKLKEEKKKTYTENSRHVNMSTREFNRMMNASKDDNENYNKNEQHQHNHQEIYEREPSSSRATSMQQANKVNKKEMQPMMFYELLQERFKSLKQWIQNVYTLIVNSHHHATTKAQKRMKQTEHILHNKFNSNNATHKKQDKESANKSTYYNKTNSPFFALHYMTVDAHKLNYLHKMYGREHKDFAKSTQSYSQQARLKNGARTSCNSDNITGKCDEVQNTCKRDEPSNKASITNSKTKKSNLPFDKTQPCRLRYVVVDGVPQIVREELVTTTFTNPNNLFSRGASSTSTSCQYGLTKRVFSFLVQNTPDTVIAFFTRIHKEVHRTILDKPVIFPSWPTSVYYRHIVLYASALAMTCIGFILLDSFISATDHETSWQQK